MSPSDQCKCGCGRPIDKYRGLALSNYCYWRQWMAARPGRYNETRKRWRQRNGDAQERERQRHAERMRERRAAGENI